MSIRLSAAAIRIAQRRDRQNREHGLEVEHDQQQRQRRDDAGELRPAADRRVDRGARIRRGDREGREQPRRDICGAEPDHLAIGVDRIAAALAEAARGDDAGGEAHEEDRAGAEDQLVRLRAGEGGQRERRDIRGDVAHHRDAVAVEVEERREDDRDHHHGDRAGDLQPRSACDPQQREHRHCEAERGPVDGVRLANEFDQRADQPLGGDVDAGHTLELADDDRERDAGEEADQDRAGEEGREHAEPEQPGAEVEAAADEREHRREPGTLGDLEPGHGREHRRHDGDRRRVRPDDQLP